MAPSASKVSPPRSDFEIAKPQSDETLVVSAAGGPTGSITGQLGKMHGCYVEGIAGTQEKYRWINDELSFDAAANLQTSDWNGP